MNLIYLLLILQETEIDDAYNNQECYWFRFEFAIAWLILDGLYTLLQWRYVL